MLPAASFREQPSPRYRATRSGAAAAAAGTWMTPLGRERSATPPVAAPRLLAARLGLLPSLHALLSLSFSPSVCSCPGGAYNSSKFLRDPALRRIRGICSRFRQDCRYDVFLFVFCLSPRPAGQHALMRPGCPHPAPAPLRSFSLSSPSPLLPSLPPRAPLLPPLSGCGLSWPMGVCGPARGCGARGALGAPARGRGTDLGRAVPS